MENYEQIEKEISQLLVISIIYGGFISPYLNIEIQRERMVEDALQQLNIKDINLKKPLRIKFIGEEGVDEGGVRKEFFQLIVKKLFEENYKIFLYQESQRVFWFNPDCNDTQYYELLGTLLGLAIYHGATLEVKFPVALYKKLQNLPTNFYDLKEFDLVTFQSLQKLLEFNEDAQNLCLNFVVELESFGKKLQFELIEKGKDIQVTSFNKAEFVNLYVN